MTPFDSWGQKSDDEDDDQTESPYNHVSATAVADGQRMRFSDDRWPEAVIEIDAEHVIDLEVAHDG